MRASFDKVAGKGLARRDEIYPLIASLIRAERTHRQARSISYLAVVLDAFTQRGGSHLSAPCEY